MSGMNKQELAHASDITKEVKEEERMVKDAAKKAVHDAKKEVEVLTEAVKDTNLADAPDNLLPSQKGIDHKLSQAEHKVEELRHAQHGDVNLEKYPRIQQVLKDTENIIKDERAMIKEKAKDGSIQDALHHTAGIAQSIYDQSWASLDSLWTNWASMLTVIAAGSAGSWKQILQESGRLINDLRHTQDFVKLINDLQTTFFAIAQRATKDEPVGEKLKEVNEEWEKQRDALLGDLKLVWGRLSESSLFKQLLAQGKALKAQAEKVGAETKKELDSAKEQIAESEDAKKLKEDFKGILQLAVGKDGPSVEPFLDYASAAWNEIVTDEMYAKWADAVNTVLDSAFADPKNMDEETYKKKYDQLYEQTKDVLDSTVHNENLRLALRESKKLMKAAKSDPTTRKLLADANKLISHLSDKKGVNLLNPQLLDEIRAVIVPVLVDHFDNAPLPDYHGRDKNALGKFNYTLSEMRLGTTGLIPSKVRVEFRYKAEANPRKLEMTYQHMYMYIDIEDIQVSFKDVKFHFTREDTLLMKGVSDNGTVDCCTAGKGISIHIKAEIHNYHAPDSAHSLSELLEPPKDFKMFSIISARCTIDDFHVRFTDTGAKVFYEMLAGIWGTKIKHQIESQIERRLNILADRFDRTLYDIVRRSTQPTLAEEAKNMLLSAGHAAGDKIQDTATDIKNSLQSM